MSEQLTNMLTDQFLQAERDIVDQVLTMHLGKAPGKVEEFLVEKIHPFKHDPRYALHFDGCLLGYVKFGIKAFDAFVSFEPAILDDQIKYIKSLVNQGLVSEAESERRIYRMIDHWSEVDDDK